MIGFLLLAAHMLGDYVTQTNWMAKYKFASGWNDYIRPLRSQMGEPGHADPVTSWDRIRYSSVVRTIHVTLYSAPFIWIGWYGGLAGATLALFVSLVFVTHWITDIRRWASPVPWPSKPLAVDQTIHLVTLAVLGVVFHLR